MLSISTKTAWLWSHKLRKIMILDECLDENTLVCVLRDGTEQLEKIKNLNDEFDLVKSFNIEKNRIEWRTFKKFDKGIQELYEIQFENDEIILCTGDHKWYVEINGKTEVIKTLELLEKNITEISTFFPI